MSTELNEIKSKDTTKETGTGIKDQIKNKFNTQDTYEILGQLEDLLKGRENQKFKEVMDKESLKFLLANNPEFSGQLVDFAMECGNVDMIKYLVEVRKKFNETDISGDARALLSELLKKDRKFKSHEDYGSSMGYSDWRRPRSRSPESEESFFSRTRERSRSPVPEPAEFKPEGDKTDAMDKENEGLLSDSKTTITL